MQVIGFVGLAQSGKTVLAKEVARVAYENGLTPKVMSFAGSLKRAAKECGADKETRPALYRKFCQEVGNKMRDPDYVPGVTGPDYWVQRTKDEIAKYRGESLVLIFDDVRYQNEVMLLADLGAEIIYVDRGLELPDPEAEFRNHDSEKMAYEWKGLNSIIQLNTEAYSTTRFPAWYIDSTGVMEDYLDRCKPYIKMWLGLTAKPMKEEN